MTEYKEREDMANAKPTEYKKIKAFNPQIVVEGTADKLYYNISYYDTERKEWFIGYGSYKLEYVQKWLADCFEKVEADVVEVIHAHWAENEVTMNTKVVFCTNCFATYQFETNDTDLFDYCPRCGAKMDKE